MVGGISIYVRLSVCVFLGLCVCLLCLTFIGDRLGPLVKDMLHVTRDMRNVKHDMQHVTNDR